MYALQWNEDDARRAWQEEAFEDGYDKAKEDNARSMLEDGVEPRAVSKWAKLPLSRVQEIKASLK